MEKSVKGFRTLAVWNKAYELTLAVYKMSKARTTFAKKQPESSED